MKDQNIINKSFNRKEHLEKLHSKRKELTHNKVDIAIKKLINNKKEINFSTVSNESGISKKTLYNNSDIKKYIEELRYKQSQVPTPKEVKTEMNNSNKDAIIASLKRRIKKLENENKKLKESENEDYVKFYENL